MLRMLLATILCAATTLPATAATFRAENGITVTGEGSRFSVPNGAGFGARGAWCAAADYARDVLGAAGTDRIYVAKARANGRAPIHFTLDPTGLTPRAVFILGASLRQPGGNLSVDHARSFCADYRLIRHQ